MSNNSDDINEYHSTKHTISTKRSLLNENHLKKLKKTKTTRMSVKINKSTIKRQSIISSKSKIYLEKIDHPLIPLKSIPMSLIQEQQNRRLV